jgi:hypothetical protein
MRELSTAMVRVVAGGHGVGTGLGMSAAGEHSVTMGRPRCEHSNLGNNKNLVKIK